MKTYKALKTDLKKLETRIAKRQRYCEEAAAQNDLDMAQMYEKDVKDLTDILNFINAGDYLSRQRALESADFDALADMDKAFEKLSEVDDMGPDM